MKLKTRIFEIESGGAFIILLNEKNAKDLDVFPGDRVRILNSRKYIIAIVDIAKHLKDTEVGIYSEVKAQLNLSSGEFVDLIPEEKPESVSSIKKKLDNKELTRDEIFHIVEDIVDNSLTQAELAYLISSAYTRGFSMKETHNFILAMAHSGEMLKWSTKPVMDLHCIGGVPGNRTTMIIVPIIAAAGLKIPKTSSRSITSPSGTADTMEVLANVSFKSIEQIKFTVNEANGCIVWGGSLNLAPADDEIVKVEHPLDLDPTPMLLSSIIAKKYVAGATHVLLDIPIGKYVKVRDDTRYNELKSKFEELGAALGMKFKVIRTNGDQPIGNGLGPALEARDILWVLKNDDRGPKDLRDKSIMMSGLMLEMAGKAKAGQGAKMAQEILDSGKAFEKMVQIIKLQGGKNFDPDKIKPGKFSMEFKARSAGKITEIYNPLVTKVARLAGAPRNKHAGVYIHKHLKAVVKKGEVLFTIYSESERKLDEASKFALANHPFKII